MRFALLLAASMAALSACAPTPAPQSAAPQDGIARASLGEQVYVDGPKVKPVAVLEDSRCPEDVQCVWAGRVKLMIEVELGAGTRTHEIATDAPIHVADGQLSLVEVQSRTAVDGNGEATPVDYRFGFTFAGGI